MDIIELTQHTDKLPQEQKQAILKIINIKTENDMKEVLQAIERMDNKFEQMDRNFTQTVAHIDKNFERNIKTFYWVVAILGASLTIGISIALALLSKIIRYAWHPPKKCRDAMHGVSTSIVLCLYECCIASVSQKMLRRHVGIRSKVETPCMASLHFFGVCTSVVLRLYSENTNFVKC